MRSSKHSSGRVSAHAPVRNLLKRLGLEEREAELYLALLPLKIARVSVIAKAAKQPRTLTYVILQKLEKKGIVSRIQKGSALHFVVESPRKLLMYAQERKREYSDATVLLEDAMSYLESLTSPIVGEPRVSLLRGMDGMKEVYRDALQHEFIGLFNIAVMQEAFGGYLPTMLFGTDIQLHGKDLLVDSPEARKHIRNVSHGSGYDVRLISKEFAFTTDTIVYDDTICLFSYDEEKTIVRIENRHLADTFRTWFAMLWQAMMSQ